MLKEVISFSYCHLISRLLAVLGTTIKPDLFFKEASAVQPYWLSNSAVRVGTSAKTPGVESTTGRFGVLFKTTKPSRCCWVGVVPLSIQRMQKLVGQRVFSNLAIFQEPSSTFLKRYRKLALSPLSSAK
jgi:hypothetical protein